MLINKCLHLQSNLTHLSRSEYVPGVGLGIAKCPYDPYDNSTAIYIEKGNPGDLPALVSLTNCPANCIVHLLTGKCFQYSGTNAEFTKADAVIFRTDLYNISSGRKEYNFKRTIKYDSKWLDSKST